MNKKHENRGEGGYKRVKTKLYDLKKINSEKPPLHSFDTCDFKKRKKYQKYSDFRKKNPNVDGNMINAQKYEDKRKENEVILNGAKQKDVYVGVKKVVQQIKLGEQQSSNDLLANINDKKQTRKYSDFIPESIKLKRQKLFEQKKKRKMRIRKFSRSFAAFKKDKA